MVSLNAKHFLVGKKAPRLFSRAGKEAHQRRKYSNGVGLSLVLLYIGLLDFHVAVDPAGLLLF